MAEKNTTTKKDVKEVKAFARFIHVSPQKLRLVADLVRNRSVGSALEQLTYSSKNAALPLSKVINSAIANAQHNFDLNKDNLYIKAVSIDGGPVYKTYAPRAQGRAFVVRKRTSHINLVLGVRDVGKKVRKSIFSLRRRTDEPRDKDVKQEEEGKVESDKTNVKQAPKPEEKVKRNRVDLKRRLFNRKSG